MSDTAVLLNRFQYCHVQDNNTGKTELHVGPTRIQLESHQVLIGTYEKIRVFEGQFALVLNPFSVDRNDILEGEREIRIGPCIFPLYPGEKNEGGVQNEFVLTDDDALLLRAQKDIPHPLEPNQTMLAGTELLLRGPRKYIPNKDITVKEKRTLVSLADAQGIYIQNNDTGKVRLVKGPTDFFLESNESLWDKRLTNEELQALGYGKKDNNNQDIRSLSGTPRPRTKEFDAVVVALGLRHFRSRFGQDLFGDTKSRVRHEEDFTHARHVDAGVFDGTVEPLVRVAQANRHASIDFVIDSEGQLTGFYRF